MKTKYPNQVIFLRHQVEHFSPKKNNYLWRIEIIRVMHDYCFIIFRHRQMEKISDENKYIEVFVIKNKKI